MKVKATYLVNMQKPSWAKVAVCIVVLAVGFTLVSGQIGQVYGYTHHHNYRSYYPYYYYYYYPYTSYGYSYYGYPYYGYGYSSYYNQYQLTVNTDPSSLSGQVSGGGSYIRGSSISFSTSQKIVQVSQDTRYVFSHWSGDYSGNGLTGKVTMDGSKTVTAIYQEQYYCSITAEPSTVPSPSGSGWYNAGDTVTLTAPSQIVGGDNGRRLVFNGWTVDGANSQASTLQMNSPHTVVAQYKQQYYLTVSGASADQTVPSGQGWYDAGTYAQIYASTPVTNYGVKIIFNGWQGDVQSTSQSTKVLMDGPKTVIATWQSDATVLYATIGLILAAIVICLGTAFLVFGRKGNVATAQSSAIVAQTPTAINPAGYCYNCGKQFQAGQSYCGYCGESSTLLGVSTKQLPNQRKH